MERECNSLVGLLVGTKDLGFEILRPNLVVAPTLPSGPNCENSGGQTISLIQRIVIQPK
jgi:hypothetical protein